MRQPRSQKSTNVRLNTLLAVCAAASLCGCAGLVRTSPARPCGQAAMLVCERFADAERCECTPRARIDAWLMKLNGPL